MNNLYAFIEETINEGEFSGCKYQKLNDKYYLVFAWIDDCLCGKIARNCDDLQYDYERDWQMPELDGDTIDTELTECENLPIECIYDTFLDEMNKITFKS